MNTKQLIVAWYALLFIAVMMFGAADDDAGGLLLRSLAVVLLAGLLIYTFGEHNQANNRRVAIVVVGGPLALALVIGGAAVLYEAFVVEEQNERSTEVLKRQGEGLYDAFGRPMDSVAVAHRNLNRARTDSVQISGIEGERGTYSCPQRLSECLRVSGKLTNGAGVTATSVSISVAITDTLGNLIDSGLGRDSVRIAPGETGSFTAPTSARPYLGANRRLNVEVTYVEFLNEQNPGL